MLTDTPTSVASASALADIATTMQSNRFIAAPVRERPRPTTSPG
jgi:hypothetical protein